MSDAKPTILAIDDAEGVRRLLEVTLGKSQVVKTAPDAHSALAWAQLATPPDLVLLDTEPAGMSGYELCKALRAMPGFGAVPVIFLAERRDPQGLVQGFQLGALDFLVKPLAAPVLLQRVRGHLEHLARERSAGLEGGELRIARLVRAMQLHERSLGGNRAKRLAHYARALAQAAGARESAADLLAKAAPVHDVGKLTVAPELLHKERTLSGEEREQFERHAALGAEIIGEHEDALLKLARTLALTHHEFWDGSGYPGRLQGNQIPSAGRVMAIVDAFESMTAAQYGGARMSTEAAVSEIVAGAGLQFDPALTEALRKAAAEFRKIHGAYPERAADAGEDLVLGATRPSGVQRAPQPAAPADDLVLGAPARDPTDDAGLTMMGPLRVGTAASTNKIREAIQRAAAKAQRPAAPPPPAPPPAAPPPPPEAPPPVDLQLDDIVAAASEKFVEAKRAQETPTQARGELEALRARVSELEAERAAARAELDALNARVNSQSQAELQLQEARGEAQIRMNELEATRAALAEARAELERASTQPVAAPAAELQQAREELLTTRAALSAAHAEREAANARVATLISERAAAEAALAHARGELAALRNKPVVTEQPQSQAEIASLRKRVNELESERSTAVAALLQARADTEHARAEAAELRNRPDATAKIEGLRKHVSELESERAAVAALLTEARAERDQGRAELEPLRARVNDMQTERAAADAARERRDAETAQAEARLVEMQGSLEELQRKREDAEAMLIALKARAADAEAALEAQTERVRIAAEQAPAVGAETAPATATPRPMATLLVVAFLLGALAMGVTTYLLLHP